MNLPDVTSGFEGGDSFAHDRSFFRSIVDLLNCNGWSIIGINYAFIILDRYPDLVLVKDRPILLYQGVYPATQVIFKVR